MPGPCNSKAAGLCEAALAADPGSVIKAINLRIAWSRLSAIDEDLGRFADAKNWWDKTAELCRQAEANPKAVHLKPKEFREWAEAGAGVFAAAVRLGLDNVAAIDAQVPDLCWRMWRLRALELSRTGRRDEAASAAIKLLDLTGTSSEGQLAAARVFARVGDVDRAIAALREAIRLEPALLADLSSYPEFVALRERPDFQRCGTSLDRSYWLAADLRQLPSDMSANAVPYGLP